jgi:glutaredoxin
LTLNGILEDGKKSRLTDEHIKSLNKLDFKWNPGKETSTLWEQRLMELAIYKQQNNGSTNVPQLFPSNKPLGLWVKTQMISNISLLLT